MLLDLNVTLKQYVGFINSVNKNHPIPYSKSLVDLIEQRDVCFVKYI